MEKKLTQEELLQIFKKTNGILEGHFLLTSGLHSDQYFEKFQVLKHPNYVEVLCEEMANYFRDQNVDVVVGPTTGGVILSYEVGKQLGTEAIFAEPAGDGNGRILKRGFTIEKGQKVLIVDDVLTTGRSVKEVIKLVESYGGVIVGIAIMVDRSNGTTDLGYPMKSLLQVDVKAYTPEECPMCQAGIPITQRGSRKMK
jgi:orotate phosphoribosyltransferase